VNGYAKIEGREGSQVADFLVLEVPDSDQNFGGSILEEPRITRHNISGRPVVLFSIRAADRHRFGDWTGENIQLPMAIVLNEEVIGGAHAPIIMERLTENVQISLGALDYEEGEKRAEELALVLQVGALKVIPKFERKE